MKKQVSPISSHNRIKNNKILKPPTKPDSLHSVCCRALSGAHECWWEQFGILIHRNDKIKEVFVVLYAGDWRWILSEWNLSEPTRLNKFPTGKIIGWITLLANGLLATVCLVIALMAHKNCELFYDKNDKSPPTMCTREGKRMFIELSLLMALISIAYILLGYKCIVGVRKVRQIRHFKSFLQFHVIDLNFSAWCHQNLTADWSSALQRGLLRRF